MASHNPPSRRAVAERRQVTAPPQRFNVSKPYSPAPPVSTFRQFNTLTIQRSRRSATPRRRVPVSTFQRFIASGAATVSTLEVRVIHLPKALARKKTFQSLNNKIPGIKFRFIDGVDTNTLNFAELKRQNLIRPRTTFRTPGCSLAHRKLWLRSVETNTPLIVCEDDAVIRRDFREQFANCLGALPRNWDILLLGYNFDSFLDVDIIAGIERLAGRFTNIRLTRARLKTFQKSSCPVSVLPLRNAFGTPGYAVSPSGANYLLRHVFPLRNLPVPLPYEGRTMQAFSMDGLMNGFYGKMKAFACLPPLAVSPNNKDPNARIVRIK